MKKKHRVDATDASRPWLSLDWRVSWLAVQMLMEKRRK